MSRPPEASTPAPHIVWLHEAHPRQLDLIGSKAVNLAVALRLKQPVPPGFVITTAAYRQSLQQTGLNIEQLSRLGYDDALQNARTIQHYLFKQSIPSDVLTAIRSAYKQLTDGKDPRVVIRPSLSYGNGLDFAKRLRPILGVKSLIELEKALKMAWAFMWLDDVVHYRFSRPALHQNWVDLALLIQPLHTPYVSGAMLTYQPEKDDQSFVIEAARGLNEAVGRGVLVPDRFVWQRFLKTASEKEITRKPLRFALANEWAVQEVPIDTAQQSQPSLNDADIRALAEIAEHLLTAYQRHLEIEWFKSEQGLQILQLTPIPAPDFEDVAPEDWQSPDALFPYFEKPFSPLGWSFWEPVLQGAVTQLQSLMDWPEDSLPQPIFRLHEHKLSLHPEILPALQQMLEQHWAGLADKSPYTRYTYFLRWFLPHQYHWVRACKRFTQQLALEWEADSGSWSTDELLLKLDELAETATEFLARSLQIRLLSHVSSVMFSDYTQHFLPADQVYDILFQSLPGRYQTTCAVLDQHLEQIQSQPEWLQIFKKENPHQILRLLQLDEAGKRWLEQLNQDIATTGFYQIGLEPLYPSWVEAPQVILHELKEALQQQQRFSDPGQQSQREALEADLLAGFSWLELPQRFFFTSLLRLNQHSLSAVQDEPFYLAMVIPLVRRLSLNLARYLPLDSRQDVFYLTLPEIHEMIQDQMNAYKIKTLRELIQARKYKRRITHRLAPEAASELEALELKGRAASRGEALGKARLILRSEDLKQLQPGEIIVTDYFEPFWEQALEKAGGLVMELGGTLSHGAMLARHYQVPAIGAVPGVTQRLSTGLIVRLDGNRGQLLAYQEALLEAHEEFVY